MPHGQVNVLRYAPHLDKCMNIKGSRQRQVTSTVVDGSIIWGACRICREGCKGFGSLVNGEPIRLIIYTLSCQFCLIHKSLDFEF